VETLQALWEKRKHDYEKARFTAHSEKEIVDCFLRAYPKA
jgi:hypothetical protein